MRVLQVATTNPDKVREMAPLLAPATEALGLEVRPAPAEALAGVVEDQPTFAGNAAVKAIAAARHTGALCLAEDSGLEVDALAGQPGVHSARFSGGGTAANNRLLLERLAGLPPERRTARFRTVAALKVPGGALLLAEGSAEGTILSEPQGAGGFGYDPLFLSSELARSFAEVPARTKATVSHRARALRALRGYLLELSEPASGTDPVPGHRACLAELTRLGIPEGIITHSVAVARVAREIACTLREAGENVDVALTAAAALLHDIGKSPGLAVAGGPAEVTPHAWFGYRWLLGRGYAEPLARAVLVHGLDALFSDRYQPVSWEDIVVMWADKIVDRDFVGLPARLADLERRYPQFASRIRASRLPLEAIEARLASACRVTQVELRHRSAAVLQVSVLPASAGPDAVEGVRRPPGPSLTT